MENTELKQQNIVVNNARLGPDSISDLMVTMHSRTLSLLLYLILALLAAAFLWSWFSIVDVSIKTEARVVKLSDFGEKPFIIQSEFSGTVDKVYFKEGSRIKAGDTLLELYSDSVHDLFSEITSLKQKQELLEKSYLAETDLKVKRIEELKLKYTNRKKLQEEAVKKQQNIIIQLESEILYLEENLKVTIPARYENVLKAAVLNSDYAEKKYLNAFNAFKKGIKTREEVEDLKTTWESERLNLEKVRLDKQKELSDTRKELIKTEEQLAIAKNDLNINLAENPESEHQASVNLLDQESEKQKMHLMIEINDTLSRLLQLEKSPKLQSGGVTVTRTRLNNSNTWRISVKSSVDGFITGMNISSPGEFIDAGKTLFSISPFYAPFVAELKILNKDIGLITEGMEVKLKFDAYPYQEFGLIRGMLWKVSYDSIVDEKTGSYYKALVRFDNGWLEDNIKKLEDRYNNRELIETILKNNREITERKNKTIIMKAGLTATAEVVKEKKRLLDLFLKPLKAAASG